MRERLTLADFLLTSMWPEHCILVAGTELYFQNLNNELLRLDEPTLQSNQ
jgi:hypothetical protein